jgi:ubiquinone/menaquinone biosynthesis C-methylase UbiE
MIINKDKSVILNWKVDHELFDSSAVTNRDSQVKKLLKKSAEEIFLEYSYHTSDEMTQLYSQVVSLLKSTGHDFKGVGLEAGSGVCGFSSNICNLCDNVDTIYAVELVPTCSILARDITIPFICNNDDKKIINVVGSFDNIELSDASVDFFIEVESYHHSDDLIKSLNEAYRVLKPRGIIVLLDRSHSDSLTEEQRNFMLNLEYKESWLKDRGYDTLMMTRRENGEHEIKYSEWVDSFSQTGFKLIRRFELRSVSLKKLLLGVLYLFPFRFRKLFNLRPSRAKYHNNELLWITKELIGKKQENEVFRKSVRDYSLFIIQKI